MLHPTIRHPRSAPRQCPSLIHRLLPRENPLSPPPASPPQTARLPPSPPPPTEYYTPPNLSKPPSTPEMPVYRGTGSPDPSTSTTRPNFRADRPITIPYAGRAEALDDRGLSRRGDSSWSKVGERPMVGEEMCCGCEKRVYAAEQVFAVNHK